MKIKTRMLVFIALPILMAILLIAGGSYLYSSSMVEGLSKSEMLETAKKGQLVWIIRSVDKNLCFPALLPRMLAP